MLKSAHRLNMYTLMEKKNWFRGVLSLTESSWSMFGNVGRLVVMVL